MVLREKREADIQETESDGNIVGSDREYYFYKDFSYEFLNLKPPKSGKYEVLIFTKTNK